MHLPAVPLVVVGLMLVAFAALSPLGVAPAWVACVAATVIRGHALARRRVLPWAVVRSAHVSFAVFLLCLGVVVAGLTMSLVSRVGRPCHKRVSYDVRSPSSI